GTTTGLLTLYQNAIGGAGGSTDTGVAGPGNGTASSTWTFGESAPSTLDVNLGATGGAGGNATGLGGTAGQGGSGVADSIVTAGGITGPNIVTVTGTMTGGAGGMAPGGAGGLGGSVTVFTGGSPQLTGIST